MPSCNSTQSFKAKVCPQISVGPAEMNDRVIVGNLFQAQVLATGGDGPYQYALSGGLPPGLTYSSDGTSAGIAGSPTDVGTWRFQITATDKNGCKVTKSYQLNIHPTKQPDSRGNDKKSGKDGDPVNPATGELFFYEPPDLTLGGPLPVEFRRYYASRISTDGFISSRLGENWLHNFDFVLTRPSATSVRIVTSEGALLEFRASAGAWAPVFAYDVPWQLVADGTGFKLADPARSRVYTFDAAGHLTAIEDGRGNQLSLSWSDGKLVSVTDGIGRTLSFAYDGAGLLQAVSDGSRSVTFSHSGTNLAMATNALGNAKTYAYAAGTAWLTEVVMPEGNVHQTTSYDAGGRVTSQTSGPGKTTSFTYQPTQTTVTDPLGEERQHRYEGDFGELTGFADEEGNEISASYDGSGHRAAITADGGATVAMTSDPGSGQLSSLTVPGSGTATLNWTPRPFSGVTLYDLSSIQYPDGTSESFTHDAFGNVVTRVDPAGKTWRYSWNQRGQLLETTGPSGGRIRFTYNGDGTMASVDDDTGGLTFTWDTLRRPVTYTYAEGRTLSMAWDAADRLLSVTDANGAQRTFQYDRNDNVVSTTDPAGKVETFEYDALDRLVSTVDRTGAERQIGFDSRDLLTSVTDAAQKVMNFGFDARRLLTSATDALGHSTSFAYDADGVLASMTNALGKTWTSLSNQTGDVVEVRDPLGNTVRTGRDSRRRISSVTDGAGRQLSFAYDPRGMLRSATFAAGPSVAYRTNDEGQLGTLVDANGQSWTHTYTTAGRLRTIADPAGRATTFNYDTRGQLASAQFGDQSSVTFTRDAVGNITRRQFSGGPDLTYTWDVMSRLTAAGSLQFTHDAAGRITSSSREGVAFGATYDAAGRPLSLPYDGNKFAVNYEWDAAGRPVSVSDTLTGTKVNLTWDDADRLTKISRPNGLHTTYTWDDADRLTRIQHGSVIDVRYTLNGAGNVVAEDFTGPVAASAEGNNQEWLYDAASSLSGAGWSSDARGRVISMPGATLTWDGNSRLTGAAGVVFAWDGLGRLQTRTEGSAVTSLFYTDALGRRAVAGEKTGSAFSRYYVYAPGGALLYVIETAGNKVRHYHFDRNGSTLALSDSTGKITDAWRYEPYGTVIARTGTTKEPFTFVGAYGVRWDAKLELYLMGARWYDPVTGRFLSRDPRRSIEPLRVNPYAYAGNDPIGRIDPEGQLFGRWSSNLVTRPESFDKQAETPGDYVQFGIDEASTWSDVLGYGTDLYALGATGFTNLTEPLARMTYNAHLRESAEVSDTLLAGAKYGKAVSKLSEGLDLAGAALSAGSEYLAVKDAGFSTSKAARLAVVSGTMNFIDSKALGPLMSVDAISGNNFVAAQQQVFRSGVMLEDMVAGRITAREVDAWNKLTKGSGPLVKWAGFAGQEAAEGNLSWLVDAAQWGFELKDRISAALPKPITTHMSRAANVVSLGSTGD